MFRCALGCVVALLLWCSAVARAQDASALARADAAYARGALLEASRAYEAALSEPGHGREELVRIHVRLGVTSVARRHEREAQEHFRAALALDPTLAAPAELAPEARARFEALRPPPQTAVLPEPSIEGTRTATAETVVGTETETATASATETATETVTGTAIATGAETIAPPTGAEPETAIDPPRASAHLPGPILTLEQCLADTACASDSARRCSLDPRCIVEPPAREPEWFEHPVFWSVVGVVIVGAAVGGTVGYFVASPPGFVLAAPEVR